MTLKDMVLEYERRLILAALSAADGHQRRAARALGLLPTTLHEKMKRLGIPTASSPRVFEAE
jgi:DNA-binding NtrC family response regulator